MQTGIDYALSYIKSFEGYIKAPVWDVNAYRLGYGSDTITNPDGSWRKVQINDRVNEAQALLDLKRRLSTEFEPKVIRKVGLTNWNKLHPKVKGALLSLAYNYGNITKQAIVDAIAIGNNQLIAKAIVTSTLNDNKKLPVKTQEALKLRRKKEADIIASVPDQAPDDKKKTTV